MSKVVLVLHKNRLQYQAQNIFYNLDNVINMRVKN